MDNFDYRQAFKNAIATNAALNEELGEAESLLRKVVMVTDLPDSLKDEIKAFLNRGW